MPGLRSRELAAGDDDAWDALVARSLNGTLFHRRRFLSYHPPGRFEDRSLCLFRGQRLAAVFPAAVIDRGQGRVLVSHPGASYGGVVVAASPGLAAAGEAIDLVIAHARELGCRSIEIRTSEKLFCERPCDELDFAMRLRGFVQRDLELSTCYDLAACGARPDAASLIATFRPDTARSTRKALASALRCRPCSERAEFDAFWDILADNLERRHGARPTHSRDELFRLKELFPDDVQLLAVFRADRMIAGVVAFVCNPRAAHTFYFASRADEQQHRPLNLAVLELLRLAAARGLRYVNFGISTEERGRVVNEGLFRFKEGFGGCGATRALWERRLDGAGA